MNKKLNKWRDIPSSWKGRLNNPYQINLGYPTTELEKNLKSYPSDPCQPLFVFQPHTHRSERRGGRKFHLNIVNKNESEHNNALQ